MKNILNAATLVLFSFLIACSKADKTQTSKNQNNSGQKQVQQQTKQPLPDSPYYRYKDSQLPFTITAPKPLGDFIGFNRSLGQRYAVGEPGHLDSQIFKDSKHGIGWPQTGFFRIYFPPRYFSSGDPDIPLGRPKVCFSDAQSTGQEGLYRISLAHLVEQPDRSWLKESLPARLTVKHDYVSCGSDAEYGRSPSLPNHSSCEIHAITLDIPPGNPLQEQKLSIEIEYLLLHPNDPENHKTAKKEINRQFCETARSFTWVTFKNPQTPLDWSRISFNQDNNGSEWPSPRVSER